MSASTVGSAGSRATNPSANHANRAKSRTNRPPSAPPPAASRCTAGYNGTRFPSTTAGTPNGTTRIASAWISPPGYVDRPPYEQVPERRHHPAVLHLVSPGCRKPALHGRSPMVERPPERDVGEREGRREQCGTPLRPRPPHQRQDQQGNGEERVHD